MTFKVTQSRIDKGLLAIPKLLAIKHFPKTDTPIKIYLDNQEELQIKNYVSYESSSTEARIMGMIEWFRKNNLKPNEEIVIQIVDQENFIYRLILEKNFIDSIKESQKKFDLSENENDAIQNIYKISKQVNNNIENVSLNEYLRLSGDFNEKTRQRIQKSKNTVNEGVPSNLRIVLREVYKGHCQICNFWFLKRDNTPYFEIHHIEPSKGNYPQNLLSVCANCHRQFTYSKLEQEFTNNWLSKVRFNDKEFLVKQIIFSNLSIKMQKELYT